MDEELRAEKELRSEMRERKCMFKEEKRLRAYVEWQAGAQGWGASGSARSADLHQGHASKEGTFKEEE